MSGLIEKLAGDMEKKVKADLQRMENNINAKIEELSNKIDKLSEGNAKK